MNRGVRQLRIVGGQLRGRRLGFPDAPGLRPTPDRVRETLFNWLAPHIPGMRVLDLFAGSGALGIEALSRGASTATFVESNREAAANLRATLARFELKNARVEAMDALDFLCRDAGPWDLALIDPPFGTSLPASVLQCLAQRRLLAPGAYTYLECPRREQLPALPEGWVVHRSGTAGEVGYHLLHDATSDLPGNI
jgi:16S rRNA (guanine966-N2)-methyltransferase